MKYLVSKSLLLLSLVAGLGACAGVQRSTLEMEPISLNGVPRPLVLQGDAIFMPGSYLIPARGEEGQAAVIVLRDLHGVEVDLSGVELRGAVRSTPRDQLFGTAISVQNCSDLSIRGGLIGGYSRCIAVEDSVDVCLDGVRFDGWYAPRLVSNAIVSDPRDDLLFDGRVPSRGVEKESAAITLYDCERVTVRGCRGRHGQSGLILRGAVDCELYENDFSFLSGWGVALFGAVSSTVSHNRFDYCIRGYSHGDIDQDQGAAAILLADGSNRNTIAFNSATHSAYGVRVLGTSRPGMGNAQDAEGCRGNRFHSNDFAFCTVSGWWGSETQDCQLVDNDFRGCARSGLTALGGERLLILRNSFSAVGGAAVRLVGAGGSMVVENDLARNEMALVVEADQGEPASESTDNWVLANSCTGNTQDLVLKGARHTVLFDNDWGSSGRRPYVDGMIAEGRPELDRLTLWGWLADRDGDLPAGHISDSSLGEWRGVEPSMLAQARAADPPTVPGQIPGREPGRAEGEGLQTIVVGEWGPWDAHGELQRPSCRPIGGVLADCEWTSSWFRWSHTTDPRADLQRWRALALDPLLRLGQRAWTDPWQTDVVGALLGWDRMGLVADTLFTVPAAGPYQLTVISDDGVRVLLDGEVVFEDWTWHSRSRSSLHLELEAGVHEVGLEYFQISGPAALGLDLRALPLRVD